jgi:hypothetical protein
MSGKNRFVWCAAFVLALVHLSAEANPCDSLYQEPSGVVPKLEHGRLVSITSKAEHTLPINKRSLVAKGTRSATLKAKRGLAEFIRNDLSAESILEEQTRSSEVTDLSTEQVQGIVEENSSQIDYLKANTEAVLNGVAILADCYDPDNKTIFVKIGWKKEFSKAAADMAKAMEDSENGLGSEGDAAERDSKAVEGAEGYSRKSPLADEF